MSGKAYSLREMKLIVDYLADHGFYNETRARKMWMDFANSKLTTRTWQSLKETFLKRILPDITNPYYRLDPDQILSFKRGLDLTQKGKKLELKPVNESVKNDVNGDNEQPSSSKNNNEGNATGEDTKCSKVGHDRASTETLILDSCYDTAEDLQKDLESTDEEQNKENGKNKPALKSVRDFIVYSEPLTPMLQEVLDDFASDEDCSDTEPPMQIDENYVAQDEGPGTPEKAAPSQSILHPNRTDKQTEIPEKDKVEEAGKEQQDTEHSQESVKPTEETVFSQLDDVMVLVDEALATDLHKKLNKQKVTNLDEASAHESSSAMTDTLLPNNQEAVKTVSTLDVQSPVLPTPQVNANQRKYTQLDANISNSNSHLISDEELDKIVSEDPIAIDYNEEGINDIEAPKQKSNTTSITTQNISKSPKKPNHRDEVHEIDSDSSTSNKDEASKVENPCLKSVSLYAEQLVTTKYSDSDSNDKEKVIEQPKGINVEKNNEAKENMQENNETKKSEVPNNDKENLTVKPAEDVIFLHSRSNSESVDDSLTNHKPLARSSLKKQKDKKLASVFGFSNGGAVKSRRVGSRQRTTSHRNQHSDSSDWTSASDSDYVSPPHGRRNRYARKYLKPHSARIMSLDEEGGLFVILGKKVYPLVKDDKAMKNYVTYLPESDPEEDDSYWKSKYIEERKRTGELKKKLGHSNPALNGKERSISLSSPISENPPRVPPSRQGSVNGNELMRRDSGVTTTGNHDTLKIKFTKHDQEVQLEGHWQHINPVLAQVVSMFHKDTVETKKTDSVTCVELSSGVNTPVDTPDVTPNIEQRDKGVHDKINEIESEIFKQIEEEDVDEVLVEQKEDENDMLVEEDQENSDPSAVHQENNIPVENIDEDDVEKQPQVTQRRKRGRPKKEASPAVIQSPAKKAKKTTERKASDVDRVKAQEIRDDTPSVARLTRSPRKLLDGITTKPKLGRKSAAKLQFEPPTEIPENPVEEAEEVRYRFPSPKPESRVSKSRNINKNAKDSPVEHLPNITSPDSLSRHSVNSSQGYQDSDTSPFNIAKRRKRRLSISASFKRRKMQRQHRSMSYPVLKLINKSSNSSFNIYPKSTRKEQSTVNSEIYKSDSYRLLMPLAKAMQTLERIDETNSDETDSLMSRIRNLRDEIMQASDPANKNDAASSSNLSLPPSPELSIVENLSINKSAMPTLDYPTINEIQSNAALPTCNSKFLLSQVDVSMPLMGQECGLQESYKKYLMSAMSNLSDVSNSAGRNLSKRSSMKVSISDASILKSLSTVNIENSDSLDKRLEQLLLESAQKPTQNRGEKMEVDTEVKKKPGSRKRCSTPHKKKTVQNKKKLREEPIIEEESKTHCLRGGRRSCPPSVNIVYYEDNAPDNLEINIHDESIDVAAVTKSKRAKKDIIKVKILRPKNKSQKRKSKTKTPEVSQTSGHTEGDNESGVFLQAFEDSGDLIHNHSETCLQIADCMGDSVEFIETNTKSIISLSSSNLTEPNEDSLKENSMESGKTTPEMFCDNAQCATYLHDARETEARSGESGNTVYFTPAVSRCNSVMTEDSSYEAPASKPPNLKQVSKWYLLSDEDSNTYFDVQNDTRSCGANLQHLFPIACAVPDLSTITEMSERNENSQKESLDVDDASRTARVTK